MFWRETQAAMRSWEPGTNDHLLWQAVLCMAEILKFTFWLDFQWQVKRERKTRATKISCWPRETKNVPWAASIPKSSYSICLPEISLYFIYYYLKKFACKWNLSYILTPISLFNVTLHCSKFQNYTHTYNSWESKVVCNYFDRETTPLMQCTFGAVADVPELQ